LGKALNRPEDVNAATAPKKRVAADSVAAIRADLARVPTPRLVTTIIFIVIALLLARFSWATPFTTFDTKEQQRVNWTLPFLPDAERGLYDIRASFAALMQHKVPQDDRVLLISYTPDTQVRTMKRSPLDRTTLAQTLTNLDGMGAKRIGIDILIDQAQPDDQLLIEALNGMKTPVWLGYANAMHNSRDMSVFQEGFLEEFLGKVTNPNVRPASLRVAVDPDRVQRSWPDQPKDLPPFLPVALSGTNQPVDYRGSILFRAPINNEYEVFNNLPIDLFTGPEAGFLADQVRGRIIVIGGDMPDNDQFDIPLTRITGESVAGMKVHATMLAQLLDRRLPDRVGTFGLWMIALFVVLAGAFTSMVEVRPIILSALIAGQLLLFGGAPFILELRNVDTYGLPAFGWIVGWLLAYLATEATVKAMGSEQKKFAHSALGKYLPKDIAAMILADPERLSLSGERMPIYTLFTDIQGFTSLSHTIPAETTASILNAYLDGMSDIVLQHGGTIDKFVGDAVVAFWGAPIARHDDADRAQAAVLDMIRFTNEFGKGAPERALLGITRIGLHYGESIVGNFGGEKRIQYTALGDAMNCAARLEGANKYLKSHALVSDEARSKMTLQDNFRPMGRITLSGRSTPIVVWEPAPQMKTEDCLRLTLLWRQFESGSREALQDIEAFAVMYDNDIALSAFADRLRETGPGGSYVLGEK
jgi:adenylate cyclase